MCTPRRDRDKFRKFESECAKRVKKKQKEELTKKIRGSLDKFFPTSNHVETTMMENNFEIYETLTNDNIEGCLNFGGEKIGRFKLGPSIQDDGSKRKFSTKLYYHNLINGEQINRFWLIYSKLEDCALCYCCKLFSTHAYYEKETSLSSKGTNYWRYLSEKLKTH
ncbi:zinc finger MYM-type protein 1-like [Aphis craccivora]|uniref:Zinc finger MYM-type protein 1-like n=1 Tax=Aphis craccivora TaxID=307492 RepID=A0A6G0XYC7_APHCR|nr:zinc finger MYM-type protein 1-like [Aphis craccivora]